jgi:general secretion pathway protein A
MEYYTLLDLKREPFSNSPDPECFYPTAQHTYCLQQLEIAVRLRRGLDVVLGEVGTGKTTLCRQLVRNLDQEKIRMGLILDPGADSELEFLKLLHRELGSDWRADDSSTPQDALEKLHSFVFDRVNNHGEVLVLLVDEGQRIAEANLELLRQLLNFEANAEKYLQIVLFGQPELEKALKKKRNLRDRINFVHRLRPMSFSELRGMINFRLRECTNAGKEPPQFSLPAMWAVYRLSKGYPRRLLHLCHHLLLGLIVSGRRKISLSDVLKQRFRGSFASSRLSKRAVFWPVLILVCAFSLWLFYSAPVLVSSEAESGPSKESRYVSEITRDKGSFREGTEEARTSPSQKGGGVVSAQEKKDASGPETSGKPGSPPKYGVVTVPEGHNLWLMAARIYGIYEDSELRERIFPEIRRMNPGLDLDALEVGQKIRFPFLQRIFKPRPAGYRICFKRTASLNSAMQAIIRSNPVRRRLWYREKGSGYEFFVLSRMGFSSPSEARKYLHSQDLKPQGDFRVLSLEKQNADMPG